MKRHAFLVSCGQLLIVTIFLLLVNCLFTCSKATGQDIITRTDSVRIAATILQLSNNEIRYRLYEAPEKEEYIISTRDVISIEHAGGLKRNLEQPAATIIAKPVPNYTEEWKRNQLSVNLIHLYIRYLSVNYEHILASGKIGIKIPLSVNMVPENGRDRIMRSKGFNQPFRILNDASGGLGIHIYPFGQNRFNYYLGPQAELASFTFDSYDYSYRTGIHRGQYLSVTFGQGALYQFSRSVVLALDVGIGARPWVNMEHDGIFTSPTRVPRFFVPIQWQMGYRF